MRQSKDQLLVRILLHIFGISPYNLQRHFAARSLFVCVKKFMESLFPKKKRGPAAFKAVGDSAIFVIAGNPACIEDLKAAGIENYVHVRCNVLETLRDFNSKLNIK